jgi:hypothetical protein
VLDLVANPPETRLLADARRRGARTVSGMAMLVYQGAESFRLWTGLEPPLDVMCKAARSAWSKMPSKSYAVGPKSHAVVGVVLAYVVWQGMRCQQVPRVAAAGDISPFASSSTRR